MKPLMINKVEKWGKMRFWQIENVLWLFLSLWAAEKNEQNNAEVNAIKIEYIQMKCRSFFGPSN